MFNVILILGSLVLRVMGETQSAAAEKQAQSTLASMTVSLEKQRTSVRQQQEVLAKVPVADIPVQQTDFFVTDALIQTPDLTAECEPLSQLEVQSLSERAAKANDLSPELVRAVMRQESAFRPCAVSSAGALGLMQLMPGTATELEVTDPMDPQQSAFGGARLLRKLMDRYSGDLNRTLGAYNAGPANVDAANGVPNFPETIGYVAKILGDLSGPSRH